LDSEETKDRMDQMGYDEDLPDDKIRLVEDPKKFMEEYLESILKSKSKENDVLEKEKPEEEPKEINSVLQRQLKSLKNSMETYGLTTDDIVNHLKKDNE